MTSIFIRDRREDRNIETRHVKEVEIGTMQPQAKDHVEPPEAERGKEVSLLEPSEGMWICGHLDFELLISTTVREYIFVFLSEHICGNL